MKDFKYDSIANLAGCKNHNFTIDGLPGETRKNALSKLYRSLIVAMLFLLVELIGGFVSGSVAILADAAHLFSDNTSYIFSIMSIYISEKTSNKY